MRSRVNTSTWVLVLAGYAAVSAAAQHAPVAGPPVLSADQAAALALNRLEPTADGVMLRHPRRTVEFAPEGVRLTSRRGAPEWRWSLEEIATASGRPLVDSGPVAPVLVEQDLLRYDRCAVLEDYRLKVDTFEQLFVIPEPLPLGGEDLVLAGAVTCEGDLAENDQGWAWRSARGEVTLGRVTVLDADGEQLPARLEVSERTTRIVVDGDALLEAAFPVTIDPEIGSNDYRISDMGPNGDPAYDAFNPAVVYNSISNVYLVVWSGDDFSGSLVEGESEIFGQVLTGYGGETGYSDVRISYAGGTGNTSYNAVDPAVAFNSTYNQYLVVWSQDTDGAGLADGEFEIWGQVLPAYIYPPAGSNFRISSMGPDGDNAYDANRPAVAYNPNLDEYLVVWDGDTDSGDLVDGEMEIWAQRVYSTGPLVGSALRMSDMGGTGDAAYDAIAPDVVCNTTNWEYLIVWQGDDNSGSLVDEEVEIYGQLITWEGVGTGPNDFRISDMGGTGDTAFGGFAPAVAYNSTRNEYLVVWMGDDNVGGLVDNEDEVFAQRMDADAGGLGSNDFRLSDVGGVGDVNYRVMYGPDVAYSPILDRYMVVWSGEDTVDGMINNEFEVFVQMLTGDASDGIGPNDERISDAGGLGSTTYLTYLPVVAANSWNGQFMAAWQGEDNTGALVDGEEEIFIQRLDGMAIFVDTFESGDMSAWSATVP